MASKSLELGVHLILARPEDSRRMLLLRNKKTGEVYVPSGVLAEGEADPRNAMIEVVRKTLGMEIDVKYVDLVHVSFLEMLAGRINLFFFVDYCPGDICAMSDDEEVFFAYPTEFPSEMVLHVKSAVLAYSDGHISSQ